MLSLLMAKSRRWIISNCNGSEQQACDIDLPAFYDHEVAKMEGDLFVCKNDDSAEMYTT
jgi:hypothetical protein